MKNLSKFSAPLPHCGEKKKRSENAQYRDSILRAFGGKGHVPGKLGLAGQEDSWRTCRPTGNRS